MAESNDPEEEFEVTISRDTGENRMVEALGDAEVVVRDSAAVREVGARDMVQPPHPGIGPSAQGFSTPQAYAHESVHAAGATLEDEEERSVQEVERQVVEAAARDKEERYEAEVAADQEAKAIEAEKEREAEEQAREEQLERERQEREEQEAREREEAERERLEAEENSNDDQVDTYSDY